MEVLDRVYNAFANLDRDFAKSKKTRAVFIADKFGGDIDIGSTIILDAISSGTGEETPEDIKKISFIKDCIENIRNSRDNLDRLSDFSFKNAELFEQLMKTIEDSEYAGTHTRSVSQLVLANKETGTVHYRCTPARSEFASLTRCTVYHVYNANMQEYVTTLTGGKVRPEIPNYYSMVGAMGISAIPFSEIQKVLQAPEAKKKKTVRKSK